MKQDFESPLVAGFRRRCVDAGLSITHQRLVIYQALMERQDHPSPERIYESVRRQIPSISLGTIYKNIKTFVDHGLLAEVSIHHGSSRLETNLDPHHHLVCVNCKSITDLQDADFDGVRLRRRPPHGFQVQRYSVEVLGLCRDCAAQSDSTGKQSAATSQPVSSRRKKTQC